MAWRWPGDKPLSEPMMVSLLTHTCICVTWPQSEEGGKSGWEFNRALSKLKLALATHNEYKHQVSGQSDEWFGRKFIETSSLEDDGWPNKAISMRPSNSVDRQKKSLTKQEVLKIIPTKFDVILNSYSQVTVWTSQTKLKVSKTKICRQKQSVYMTKMQ